MKGVPGELYGCIRKQANNKKAPGMVALAIIPATGEEHHIPKAVWRKGVRPYLKNKLKEPEE
jgi:hypothetical protein